MRKPDRHERDDLAALIEQRNAVAATLPADRNEPGDAADAADEVGRASELRRLDARIDDLRARIESPDLPPGELPIGTRAVLRYPDGDTETFTITAVPEEGNSRATAITPDSPLALALADHAAGDAVTWKTPASTTTATLLELHLP